MSAPVILMGTCTCVGLIIVNICEYVDFKLKWRKEMKKPHHQRAREQEANRWDNDELRYFRSRSRGIL
jgi:hypothetical protein